MLSTHFYRAGFFIIGFFILAQTAYGAFQNEILDRPLPNITLYASPQSVVAGKSAKLIWNSQYATQCTASGGGSEWSGSKERDGSRTIRPSTTTTYTLTCKGRGGTSVVSTTVEVIQVDVPPPPPPQPPQPPQATSTPPTPSPTTTPTSTPPTEPPPQPPVQPTTTPPVTCAAFAVPSCGAGTYPTPGAVDSKGCIGASQCTQATTFSSVQVVAVPSTNKYPVGAEYGSGAFAGSSAAIVYAPATSTASVVYTVTGLDARKVWHLSTKVGLSPVKPAATTTTPKPPTGGRPNNGSIQGATYGGSVKLIFTATAGKIDSSDKESEVLATLVLTPQSGVQTLQIPLGVWGMRPNLVITATVEKAAKDALVYGAVIDSLGVSSFGERPDQGIVNNDPEWKSVDQQNKQLAALATFPVTWIHDSIRTTGASWVQAPLLKREQDLGKKIQLVVNPIDEDYDLAAGARVPNTNEWGGALPLSKINLDLYETRLRNNLTSYKNAGVDVKAVEVGNEFDLVAFNADIPLNRAPTDADYQLFVTSYAKFLERTVSVVKRPEFYPNAKIILGSPALDWSPAFGKLEPGRMYAPLKNLNGKNYFALVDGIGVHYYPADTEDGAASLARTKAFLNALGETGRPLWVTEWGFYNNRFPNAAGKDRYRAFVDLYDKILRADVKVVFMSNFALDEFSFPFHLVDSTYKKLPEARFFDQYPSPVPSPLAVEPVYTTAPVACVTCSIMEWYEEVVADVRDFVLAKLSW